MQQLKQRQKKCNNVLNLRKLNKILNFQYHIRRGIWALKKCQQTLCSYIGRRRQTQYFPNMQSDIAQKTIHDGWSFQAWKKRKRKLLTWRLAKDTQFKWILSVLEWRVSTLFLLTTPFVSLSHPYHQHPRKYFFFHFAISSYEHI